MEIPVFKLILPLNIIVLFPLQLNTFLKTYQTPFPLRKPYLGYQAGKKRIINTRISACLVSSARLLLLRAPQKPPNIILGSTHSPHAMAAPQSKLLPELEKVSLLAG